MITSILAGGLGNQMLHYAIGRAQALKFNTEYCMDLSMYMIFKSRSWMREYELDSVFDLPNVKRVSRSDKIKKAQLLYLMNRNNKWDGKIFQRIANVVCIATPDDVSQRINKDSTIYGLDLSIRYIKDYLPQIKRELTFKSPLSGRNKDVAEEIMNGSAVSLHVRRGDYLNSTNIKSYAQIDVEWYYKAIETIKEKDPNVTIYVFSDDIAWCRQIFAKYETAQYVDWNTGADSYRDMQLMSLCRYNIIANSSFSRMAALLNKQQGQIVVCPSRYMIDEAENSRFFQVLPENWIIQ